MQAQIKSIPSLRAHPQTQKLTECFHFLRALACKNLKVQQRYVLGHSLFTPSTPNYIKYFRLLEYISLFLKAATFIGAPVGTLLQEIFSGGPSISLKVKEEVVVRMMHLVFVKEESNLSSASLLDHEGRAAMVMALQELVQV